MCSDTYSGFASEVMVAAVVEDEAVGSDSDDLMEVEDTLQVRLDNEFDDSTLVMD